MNIEGLTAKGGTLVIYDILSQEGEAREACIQRFAHYVETHWVAFSPEQRKNTCEHVSRFDFPISWSTWTQLARDSGFNEQALLYRDGHAHYGLMTFS